SWRGGRARGIPCPRCWRAAATSPPRCEYSSSTPSPCCQRGAGSRSERIPDARLRCIKLARRPAPAQPQEPPFQQDLAPVEGVALALGQRARGRDEALARGEGSAPRALPGRLPGGEE